MLPRITIEGRLTADPELRFGNSGTAIASFTVVAADRKKDSNDQWVDDKTLFLRCTAFRKIAENIAESCEKGDLVLVTGKLSTNEWTDKEGNKRSTTELVVDTFGVSLAFRTIPHGAGKAERGSSSASAPADDPWATPAPATAGDDPPF